MSAGQVQATENNTGYTYRLTKYGNAFIEFASTASHPVMDIGAAFGVATIPALDSGAHVIAVDIEARHLAMLARNVSAEQACRLSLLERRFPDFDVPAGSLSAVYISQVLPFLNGFEIETGFAKISRWLVPDGKVFIVSFSPYLKHCESYIPIYAARLKDGVPWAGRIENLRAYSHHPISRNLPEQVTHVDVADIRGVLLRNNFDVEIVEFFGDENDDLPDGAKYDGRERVGAIGVKQGM